MKLCRLHPSSNCLSVHRPNILELEENGRWKKDIAHLSAFNLHLCIIFASNAAASYFVLFKVIRVYRCPLAVSCFGLTYHFAGLAWLWTARPAALDSMSCCF